MGETISHQVTLLEPPYSDFHWPRIEQELDTVKHIWAHRYTKEALFEAIARQMMQLWVVGEDDRYHLVVVTQIQDFPIGRILQVVLAFGNQFEKYLPTLDATLDRFAQIQECQEIEVIGRDGFQKLLAGRGFARKSIVLSRPVKKETLQ